MGRINHTKIIAERVDASRKSLGLAVNKLSEDSDIPRSSLQRKVKGATEFTVGELINIADQMEVDPEEWIKGLAKASK
jgi:transcriptional regulator with XRE-family HTH domain